MPHVLVVDDDPDVRVLLGLRVRSFGHTVVTAGGAAAALRAVSADQPLDLALLDVAMPGLHGFALLDRLRDHLPGLPAVLVTGARGMELKAESARAHLLRKPFPSEALRRVIDLALESEAPPPVVPLPAAPPAPVPGLPPADAAAEINYATLAGRAALALRRDLETLRRSRLGDGGPGLVG